MYLYKNDHTYLSTVNQTPLATDDYEDEMSTVLIFPTTTVDTSVENVPETSALSISTTVNTESSHQSTLVAKTKSPLPSLTSPENSNHTGRAPAVHNSLSCSWIPQSCYHSD